MLPMASSLSTANPRNETTRVTSMLSLPAVCPNITSKNPCKQDGMPSASIYVSSGATYSSEVTSTYDPLPEQPQCERSNSQPSFRPKRFYASSVSAKGGGMSLQDVTDSIVKEVPNALVAHVHDGTRSEASTMIHISGSLDFDKAFNNSSPSFILVDSSEQSVNLTIEMLRNRTSKSDGVVIIVMVQEDAAVDLGPIIKKVPDFVDGGADDIIVIPLGATNMNFTIMASLAKASACRDQRMKFKTQVQASNHQGHKLLWKVVEHFLPDFPKKDPQLQELGGRRVGDMVFVRRLGEGAYGSVYKCVHDMRNTTCAVKVFPKINISSATRAIQIATEMAVLQRLEHKNVVALLGAAQGMHCVYIFMEFAGPRNLFKMIRVEAAQGLPWACAAGFFSQIAAGVAHCHKMQVAHCDLKPENIVISESGCVKIVDFGQAVDFSEDVATLPGPLGTMPFMSPEILCSRLDWEPPKVDMWSLGVVLVDMLCGTDAFVGLLGWHALGRELTNPSTLALRADELKVFFSKDETNAHGHAIMTISDLCRDVPPPPMMELLGNMLELVPEHRISAESAVERIETM